jgi:hypothetical protein
MMRKGNGNWIRIMPNLKNYWAARAPHRKKRRGSSGSLPAEQLDGKDKQADYKNKNADPVDAVHITDPFILRAFRVFLPEVKIFRDLAPYSHGAKVG